MSERGVCAGSQASEQLCQGLDLGQIMSPCARQAMVYMVVDQRPLRLGHGALDGVQLRGQIDARPPLLDHADDAAQMPSARFSRVAMAGWLAWV